jgi:tryptophanyl-tRNA synthetase
MWAGPGSIDTAIFPERLLSGFQPTKSFHLGHWSGAIQPCHRFQNLYPGQCYLVVADLHAMTGRNSGESMRATTQAAACSLLALGIDPDRCVIYRQSDAPQVCELMWILACSLGKGHLDRSHAYKAAVNRGTPVSVGLFLYPLLQVADILAMRSTRVPAGPDQRQSVELARDVARRVNYLSNTLVLPEPTLASSGDSIALLMEK